VIEQPSVGEESVEWEGDLLAEPCSGIRSRPETRSLLYIYGQSRVQYCLQRKINIRDVSGRPSRGSRQMALHGLCAPFSSHQRCAVPPSLFWIRALAIAWTSVWHAHTHRAPHTSLRITSDIAMDRRRCWQQNGGGGDGGGFSAIDALCVLS
jgi:hypothetical protein